ncbi:Glycosyl transferase family 2 [Hymenobacter daecheongensis DSM 21074]|uniref:Glycosyl transferase family 2 n=1 Tax=Hymenobacter daecheongensis DSM 21074 TaxID=1121955 RepID=A0A1M6GFY4_9BACT|nr:glycosyltransferase [Hymenobacter daecheongensis]SHJ08866.1 Glycosyl transferase family 2 [Hymenobacter daecheongensis DSM 21074]
MPPADLAQPGVTLLICTHNGAARLAEVLRYVAAQQVSAGVAWEVLLISNASQDDTLAVAHRLGQELLPAGVAYRVLDEPKPGKENALVRGLNEARYEAVAIVDDDNLLAPDYTQIAHEVMQAHPEIGVLGACAEGGFEVPPPAWFKEVQGVYAIGPQNGGVSGPYPDKQGFVYGAGSVVRRSGWLKLRQHGFHFLTQVQRGKVLAGGEDIELGEALRLAGYQLWYDERLRFRHFMYRNRLTWDYLLRIGPGAPSALLIHTVYFFVSRYPDLSAAGFRLRYAKHLVWLATELARQAGTVATVWQQAPGEGEMAKFKALRQLHNFRVSLAGVGEAQRLFGEVRALQQRLAQSSTSPSGL